IPLRRVSVPLVHLLATVAGHVRERIVVHPCERYLLGEDMPPCRRLFDPIEEPLLLLGAEHRSLRVQRVGTVPVMGEPGLVIAGETLRKSILTRVQNAELDQVAEGEASVELEVR